MNPSLAAAGALNEMEETEKSDAVIISRCQKGDKQAYGLIVKRYMERAYFTALALVGSHEQALDLSQDAFVRAFRNIKKFETGKKFFTWYYRILKNLCLNYLRDHARHARPFSEIGELALADVPDNSPDAAARVEVAEIREIVWQGLNTLKESEREIIILKDFQNFSYKEIAEILECPIGTVMSRLYSARKALKSKLEKYIQ